MKLRKSLVVSTILLLLLLLASPFLAAEDRGYTHPEYLISVEELSENMDDENLVIIDVRNTAKYFLGHLPGSVQMWGDDFTDPDGWVPGLAATPEQFTATAQAKGINNDSKIVVYDDNNGLWASRLWFVFRYYGHDDVRLLEGGYDAWTDAGHNIRRLPTSVDTGNFTISDVKNDWIVDTDTVAENIDNQDFVVLDTRSESEYLGEDTNPGADRMGRVPGSVHIEWTQHLNEDNTFKTAAEIRELYEEHGITDDLDVIASLCHTAVRAAHSYLALEMIGYENVKVYDESWVGWANREDLPIETN
ncbi:sulfurtransferase [Halanaerobium hydrogeniformans]|uniref:thiosulfate sulfurtransferase n=1 Tax=Halanaerobium hydrogeniformans TaxID=656519 RepID=E4RJQ4_HALHG|nr:sulfurtransferase [Halanaerobium hydrogeniformans]ADQ15474.1 Rhodanese domain protein [Halanaerobium hydrogeniformans]